MTVESPPIPQLETESFVKDDIRFTRSERAAYDLRGTEWDKYGQTGGSIFYSVSNGRRAVAWEVLLKNYVNDEHEEGVTAGPLTFHYHPDEAPEYLRTQHSPRECGVIDGRKCYADLSYIAGQPGEQHYESGSDEAVYEWLLGELQSFLNE